MGEKKDLESKKTDNIRENGDQSKVNTVDYNEYEGGQGYNREERKKKVMVISVIVVLLVGLTTTLWFKGYDIVNYVFTIATEKAKEKDEQEKVEEVLEEVVTPLTQEELLDVYDRVHRMVNTIIIAEDGLIWGTESITKEGIEDVLEKLNGNDDNLYNDISKWLELDFSNAVDVHNYVWGKFDGSEGRAIGINEEVVEEVKKVLSN